MVTVPALVKHMTLAVLRKAELSGTPAEKFHAALKIALAQCARYGFIGAAGTEDLAQLTLTPTGTKKDAAHRREPDSFTKSSQFDVLALRYGFTPGAAPAPVQPTAPVPVAPAAPASSAPPSPPPHARIRER